MKKKLTLLILPLFFILATSFLFFNSSTQDHALMARKIRNNVGIQLAKKHQMELCSVSEGLMKRHVNTIGFGFQINLPLNRDEIRSLMVDCAEELLKAFNQNKEIRPYLKNYPFLVNNLDITLYMTHKDGSNVYDPLVAAATINESDKIYYYTGSPNKVGYEKKYSESYAEAVNIVKNSQKKYFINSSQNK